MNERDLIAHLRSLTAAETSPDLIKGMGDDCAVVDRDGRHVWLLTVDTMIESVHFDCRFHPPELLGRKSISVNVSDVGAMGGRPRFALLSLGLPGNFETEWFADFARGLTGACKEYGCLLIGGDTVASPQGINISLTLIGEAKAEQVVYRSGAQVGDTIWVSGPLGWAAGGLALLQKNLAGDAAFAPLVAQHQNPRARVELGASLGESGLVHAMMDLSDGLATDLAHLCTASQVGAQVLAEKLPGQELLQKAAHLVEHDPVQWAVSGGEDFELLFTAPPASLDALMQLGHAHGLPLTPIGTITQGAGVTLLHLLADGTTTRQVISYQGYDHFVARKG